MEKSEGRAGGSRTEGAGAGKFEKEDVVYGRLIPRCNIHPGRIGAIAYSYVKDEYIDPADAQEDVDGPQDEICCPPCALERHGIEAGFKDGTTH